MEYIETDHDLRALSERLSGETLIAADSEAAGYHRYSDAICLIQLSTRADTFLVDSLAVGGLEPLEPLFGDADVEIVFHDADYDLRLLHRDHGITVRGLFDTKIAAELLGEPGLGLSSMLEKYLGIELAKKYQRADWARRPLPPEMLEYAALDTRYLPALRDLLRTALEDRGRLAWAEEDFRILEEEARWTVGGDEAPAFLQVKGTRDLDPRRLAALRELYDWRESQARSMDRAPFRVVSDDVLVEAARRLADSDRELLEIKGVSRRVLDRFGSDLLGAVRKARQLPERELPRRPERPRRPPPDPEVDAAFDRLKAVRDRQAARLGLDRGVLMPRSKLEELARAQPSSKQELTRIPGIRQWQVKEFGDELVSALEGNGAASS